MRARRSVLALPSLLIALTIARALAQPAPPPEPREASLRIEAPATLPLGAGRIEVVVRPPLGPALPLLLTVHVEGEALQAVRARFLRADAKLDRERRELRFEVPVLARAAGIALVRAELSTYRCEQRCQPVRAQAARQVQVVASTP